MAGNWLTSSGWVIVVFVGAFALLGAIIWARAKNKGVTRDQHRQTEQATRDLYKDPLDDISRR